MYDIQFSCLPLSSICFQIDSCFPKTPLSLICSLFYSHLFFSHHFVYYFLSRMSSLLLHYPLPLLHSFFILSSPFPAFRVMYGPCQHWNQWDASCFNLASEPSGSRSSASWKSDGAGLSLPCLHSPPNALPCCIDQHLAPTGQGFADAYTIWTPRRISEFTSCLFTLSVFLSLPVTT